MATVIGATRRAGPERTVRTFLPVVGPAAALMAAFAGDPGRWMPDARNGEAWYVTVRAGSLARTVRARLGAPWQAGAASWRTLTWDPVPEHRAARAIDRLLPTLDGELGLHLDPDGRTTLVLDARYRPPGGALGAAVDAVGLHRVARETVERLLEEVAARLSAEAQHLDVGASTGRAGPS
jgi:hypothetical protein